MKVTLKTIADETDVSQMTVSRILRGKADGQVSPSVRERVVASLAAHRYDFQQSARKSTVLRTPPARKIVAIMPYSQYLSNPPNVNRLIFYRFLEEHCRQNSIRLEYVVGLRDNDNNRPAWEELQKIPPGTPVLFHSSYGLTSAIALQQQGCRVGLVLRDLFWRNFYAPQLKKMSCFTLKTAEGIFGTLRAMRLSGCQRIACCTPKDFQAEPGFPPLAAYEYERRINGIAYCHVISLADKGRQDCRDTFRKVYSDNPFDGLYVPEQDHYAQWSRSEQLEFASWVGFSIKSDYQRFLELAIKEKIPVLELNGNLFSLGQEEQERILELLALWRRSGGCCLSLHVGGFLPDMREEATWEQVRILGADRITKHVPAVSVAEFRERRNEVVAK